MKKYFEETVRLIDIELESFSIDTCDISTDVSFKLVEFLHEKLNDLRDKFIDYKFTSQEFLGLVEKNLPLSFYTIIRELAFE